MFQFHVQLLPREKFGRVLERGAMYVLGKKFFLQHPLKELVTIYQLDMGHFVMNFHLLLPKAHRGSTKKIFPLNTENNSFFFFSFKKIITRDLQNLQS